MNDRICPSEEILSEYLNGTLAPEDKTRTERHLAGCATCRKLLAEAHDVISKPDIHEVINNITTWIKKNRWFIGALSNLIASFLFSRYFLQFLAAGLLMGAKWIIDSKATKMLIMIHEAYKRGDAVAAKDILSKIDSNK